MMAKWKKGNFLGSGPGRSFRSYLRTARFGAPLPVYAGNKDLESDNYRFQYMRVEAQIAWGTATANSTRLICIA